MFVADPQLIDNHTYPSYNKVFLKITKHTSDQYLKRNFKFLSYALDPNSIIFLGDYQDNGRSSSDAYYKHEMTRFHDIFKNYNDIPSSNFITSLPGNHDIGWKNGITERALKRFEESFGDPVPYEISNVLFIPINSLALSNTQNEKIYSKPRKVLEDIAQQPKDKPRVLLTHVPLMRSKEASCGPLRESKTFPFTAGYQYQSVLDADTSEEILSKTKPDLVFSGDDHDYCFVQHKYKDNNVEKMVNEITVKSISMTMGVNKPAVQLMAIHDENIEGEKFDIDKIKLETTICLLPTPYNDIIMYIITAVISGVTILINAYKFINKLKRYYGYNKVQSPSLGSSSFASKESLLSSIFSFSRNTKPESPYASSTNATESFRIDIEDEREEYSPINAFRKRARTRANSLYYSTRYTLKYRLARLVSIVLAEYTVMAGIAIALYFVFVKTV